MPINIRNMQASDLPAVMTIQAACYTDIVPESATSMLAKLLASPATCFVVTLENTVNGYLIALPWEIANPPALNAESCELPKTPNCLYLHDLAITPQARGSGAAPALVETFIAELHANRLEHACLIAIQDSAAYWQRYGFEAVLPSDFLAKKIASYGGNVVYMELLQGSQSTT